jgi:NADH-quinone oxidoreductase chain G
MITLTIDGKKSTVKAGSTILEAAQAVSVRIPTLCASNKLHPYGGCRVCLVEVEGTPRKFTPSCTTPAADGMVVRTMSPAISEARKTVLELLLISHPLECPICDKGGECELQDLVQEYGLGKSRFDADKKYLPPDYVSPLVERNLSRCILCGKCVRICDEQNAVGEWAFTRRGTRARVSTDFDRPLDCEFCGECIEICPVGALTSRQFRYRGRPWNLTDHESVCTYCGNGCAIRYQARDGKVVRVKPARANYLCAKGRFGWDAVHHAERITTPKMRVNGVLVDCTWDEALSVVATNLNVIRNKRGADSIGGLGSVRTTNEESYLFQKFLRTVVGTNNVDMLARIKSTKGLNSAFFSGETAKIADHDAVLVLEKNVGELNPLTGIEIVRAVNKRDRKLVLVNDEHNKFNKIAAIVLESTPEAAMKDLIAALSKKGSSANPSAKAAELLAAAATVAMVLPARISDKEYGMIKELTTLLKGVTYYPVVRRSNFQGSLDMGVLPGHFPGYQAISVDSTAGIAGAWNAVLPEKPGMNALEMIAAAGSGKLAALYIMGDDPAGSDPSIAPVLDKLDFLVVQDIFMTDTAKLADVVLPAASSTEKDGTFTNVERRLQQLTRAEAPAGESRPDWDIIQLVARKMGSAMQYRSSADILKEIRSVVPLYRELAVGAVWPKEKSPLTGTDEDLSLASDRIMQREVMTAERLLFSSGMMITRSEAIGTIRHFTLEV